ncbi:hypothetical protein HMPREF9701_03543 [Delftia acidovorans CCUG 274B]|uniref:type II toxin-antitoxin system VapC family toxin n=1 Tax=Delftia TaxID=80865 RepID=UPI000352B226|nr:MULTISPECIES: type II toxin-antitoxin system VapC family toxin [Delftia]EPD38439.1 hypothetical protein HMPREF9701_03543 [Delftia acidovorans CCUG 274B]MCX7508006.1 type II toxin-antitoxin system VapC family toxin [Delftia tsuruhatensis]PZP76519.1 MAG: type II toxin-antitoxin system VapC family toxin [Delftia acidovorans]
MTRYLLDTNIASHIIKGDIPAVREQLVRVPMHQIAVSAVTQAELMCGVAKRGHPAGLSLRVTGFLARVEVLPWTAQVADAYGHLRAACEAAGITLASMDMMIAAHALLLQQQAAQAGERSVLVTRDRVFSRIPEPGLAIADWTTGPAG